MASKKNIKKIAKKQAKKVVKAAKADKKEKGQKKERHMALRIIPYVLVSLSLVIAACFIMMNFEGGVGAVGLLFLLSFLTSQIWESICFIKRDRFLGSVSLGLVLMAMLMMFTNTPIVFTSPIDSYFLTIFMFVVPKYVRNAISKNRFYV